MNISLLSAAATGQRVYFLSDGAAHIKIGTSKNVTRRGGELRGQVILSLPGTELQEREQHRMWRGYRLGKTEWFYCGEGLLLYLFALAAEAGDLAALAVLVQLYHNRWNGPAQESAAA